MSRHLIIPLLVLTAVATSASAQEPVRIVQPQDTQTPVFSSRAELVVVHVTVKDRRGAYATGLPREAFRMIEDGTPQRIDFFSGDDSPVTVGLLVDSSGSMREARERVIAAATAFAEASNANDEIFALAFNEHVRAAFPPSMPFTSDANVFRVALAGAMGAQGRTAMYDAISNGLSYVAKGHHPRRVLVVVGDGGDNASTTTFEQVLREAQASNAAIYTVGIIDPLEREANPGLLKRLAQATGGESFFPRRVDDVDGVLQEIARDIRNSYTLGYVSSNSVRDGQFRRIRVVVTDSDRRSLRVRARDGYRAGEPRQGKMRSMGATRTDRIVRWIERGLAAIGVVCLIWAGTASMSAVVYQGRQRVLLERHISSVQQPEANHAPNADVRPAEFAGSIGRLEIPRIGLSAVVAEGDDEHTLKVAVGHLPDTPLPWQEGNVALAGHRDTFFRPLRRISVGDDIRLTTPRGDYRYRVTRQTVVDPEELWVLDASSGAALTLITCYPFDFVGPAPRRFVVHAERITDASGASQTTASGGVQ